MYRQEVENIRQSIRELARQFGLKYEKELYQVTFLTPQELIILQFLIGCPEPIYVKFGKTVEERVKRVEEFLSSREYAKAIKQWFGGSVVDIKGFQKNITKLKNKELKKKYEKILRKLKPSISNKAVVIALPQDKRKLKFAFKALFHEWIHLLLLSNKICFQNLKPKYWKLDEGLTTYLQTSFETKKIDISEIIRQKIKRSKKSSLYALYAKNALKFNTFLKNKKDHVERKKAILRYFKKLRK
jgi:hypothetical protein